MTRALAIAMLVAITAPSHADDTVARDAFRRAQELATANRWVEACPLFEASYRADPQIGVLLHLADCHERVGRFASAWAAFNDAAELAKGRQDPREAVARDRAAALAPKLSKLQVTAPPTVIPGLVVKRDGVDITVLVGTEMAVDPGRHTITASAPGYVTWTQDVTIAGTGTTPLALPPLEKEPEKPVVKQEGTLTVQTQADAEIWIDSQRVATGTYTGTLAAGGHTLRVVAPGMRAYQTEVLVAAGATRTIDVPLEKEIVVAPSEPTPTFELAASLAPGVKLRSDNPFVVALRAEAALRLGRRVNFGTYVEYARLDRSGSCGTDIPGPTPATPFDIGPRNQLTNCSYVMPGLQLFVHLLPKRRIDPYLGITPGFRFAFVDYQPADMTQPAGSETMLAIVAPVRAGVTYHPSRAVRSWTLGGYVEASITVIGDNENIGNFGESGEKPFMTLFAGARSTVTF